MSADSSTKEAQNELGHEDAPTLNHSEILYPLISSAQTAGRRWVNPYAQRLRSHSEQILEPEGVNNFDQLRARVRVVRERFRRLFVEYGSGSGGFLLDQAASDPEALCVGFELRFKRVVRTLEKAADRGISNILMIRTPAQRAPLLLEDGTVDALWVNFPDPWHKQRWEKHRLLTPRLLMVSARLLKIGARFSLKTDHQEYFEQTLLHLAQIPELVTRAVSRDLHASEYAANNILSEFEKLFRSQGKNVYFVSVERRDYSPK